MTATVAGPWMGLRAALQLARGRAEDAVLIATEGLGDQMARARHSFLAMLFCMPFFLAVQLVAAPQVSQDGAAMAPTLALVREFASVALGWLGYAVLSHQIAHGMGRGAQ